MKKLLAWCKIDKIFRTVDIVTGFACALLMIVLIFWMNKWVILILCLHSLVWFLTYIWSMINRRIIKNIFYKYVNDYLKHHSESAQLLKLHTEYDNIADKLEYTLYFADEPSDKAILHIKNVRLQMQSATELLVNFWYVNNYYA